MPWEVSRSAQCPPDKPWAVLKENGELVACHATEEEAQAQMRALYASEEKAVWSTAYVNDLPDSAFLYVEEGGEKDADGKTVPRDKRHFPYRNAEGKVDLPHLRNAIARIPQSNAPGLTAEKKAALQERARKLLAQAQEDKGLLQRVADAVKSWLLSLIHI